MRFVLPMILVAGCSGPVADAGPAAGSFSGTGRDRLCVAGAGDTRRAGVVTFGAGHANCSAAGVLVKAGRTYELIPQGEGACRIGLSIKGDTVEVTSVPAACAYYCGPDAALSGKRFRRDAVPQPVTDFAGDPLC